MDFCSAQASLRRWRLHQNSRKVLQFFLSMENPTKLHLDDIWNVCPPIRVQGNSLKTWSFDGRSQIERVQVSIRSVGRPIEASVQLWETPSYNPLSFKLECEDASENIVHTIIEMPLGHPATIAVYNTESLDFPMEVSVTDITDLCPTTTRESFAGMIPRLVQGGQVQSFNFCEGVDSVEVFFSTEFRDMKAYIEILQGPNDDNEIIEVDSKAGYECPFYTVIQTPGGSSTLRIANQNNVEFPFYAYVRPYESVSNGESPLVSFIGPYF